MTDSQAERLRRAERMAAQELIAMARDWPVMESDAGDAFTGDRLIRALGEALAAALPLPREAQAQRIDHAAWCGNSVYHDEYPPGQFDARCGACRRSRHAIEQLLTDVALPGEAQVQQQQSTIADYVRDIGKWQQRCAQAETRYAVCQQGQQAILNTLNAAEAENAELRQQLATREALDPVLIRQAVESAQRIKELEEQRTSAKPLMEGQLKDGIVQLQRAKTD